MTLRRPRNGLIALIAALVAAFLLFAQPATAAFADTTDDGQEVTDYYFGGVITFDDEPVADVVMTISGSGFEGKTTTDAEGKWRLYVPEKEKYTLTVDESTLPDGVIVDATQLPEGTQPIAGLVLARRLVWVSIAALGVPVVPPVWRSTATSEPVG